MSSITLLLSLPVKLSNSTHTSLMIRACVAICWLIGFAEADDGVSDCLVFSVQGSWQGGGLTPAARAGMESG